MDVDMTNICDDPPSPTLSPLLLPTTPPNLSPLALPATSTPDDATIDEATVLRQFEPRKPSQYSHVFDKAETKVKVNKAAPPTPDASPGGSKDARSATATTTPTARVRKPSRPPTPVSPKRQRRDSSERKPLFLPCDSDSDMKADDEAESDDDIQCTGSSGPLALMPSNKATQHQTSGSASASAMKPANPGSAVQRANSGSAALVVAPASAPGSASGTISVPASRPVPDPRATRVTTVASDSDSDTPLREVSPRLRGGLGDAAAFDRARAAYALGVRDGASVGAMANRPAGQAPQGPRCPVCGCDCGVPGSRGSGSGCKTLSPRVRANIAAVLLGTGDVPGARPVGPEAHIQAVTDGKLHGWEAITRHVGARPEDAERVRQAAAAMMRELPRAIRENRPY